MTNSVKPGTIEFLGSVFKLDAIENAFNKAVDTDVKAGVEIHQLRLDVASQSAEWKKSFKKPIVTQHEGRYVFLYVPETFTPNIETIDGKLILKTGFKARFVTKYNFNRAKFDPNASTVVQEPLHEENRYSGYPSRSYGYHGRPNHGGGGYQGNRRPGGRDS